MKKLIVFFFVVLCKISFCQSMKLGDSLVAIGQYSKAIEEYNKQANTTTWYKIAKAYESLDDYNNAILNYEKIRAKDSTNLQVNFQYALALLNVNNVKSSQVLEQISKEHSSEIYSYYLGVAYEKQKKEKEAIEAWKTSVKINPNYFKSTYKLCLTLANKKEFDGALEVANSYLNNNANNIDILKIRGQVFYFQKKYEPCISDFEKVLLNDDNDVNIVEKLANAYLFEKEYKKAIPLYSQLIESDSNENPNLFYNRGKCYGFILETEKAEKDILASIEMRTHTFENEYFYLGYFNQQQEQFEKAMKFYQKVLSINKNHAEAAYQIIAIKDFNGQSSTILIKEYQVFLEKYTNISVQRQNQIKSRIKQLEEM